ncbi:single-stranded DNA-binding protein [Streptomyces sp. NBC_01304]|uniref:single-stranded DNA-binding protein n=1 Tax=Streptomyces sp. NBC_01304 TaxID=2903818 RepID=UPI002E133207|nr:single-stranded DNA-binding protein [Streptomyces sp. NBC_01304]
MNDTLVTVVGNVATAPVFREAASGPMARFRLAVTPRHYDRNTQEWKNGQTNFFTVWCWRGLAVNVGASVSLGDPVVVQGRLKVRTEDRGGQHWTSADIEALSMGHDLARGTSAFRRAKWGGDASLAERQEQVTRSAMESEGLPEPQFERPPRGGEEEPPEGGLEQGDAPESMPEPTPEAVPDSVREPEPAF